MFRLTYALNPSRRKDARITLGIGGGIFLGDLEKKLSREYLNEMLMCLTRLDIRYLLAHPETPRMADSGVLYREEPPGQEDWQDIPTCLKMGIADCLPLSTLLLKDDYTFVPLADICVGDRIMDNGTFVEVCAWAASGEKPLLAFELNNGCVLRTSARHRLVRPDGSTVRAEDLKVGDKLTCPSKAFPTGGGWHPLSGAGSKISQVELAWLVGTYIADGWHQQAGQCQSFSISGCDKNPKRRKREQKERTQGICADAGIRTSWRQKSIRVADRELASLMHECGTHAPNKRVVGLPHLSRTQVRAITEGLQTDSSTATSGTITYGTTSSILALQLRVLHRMLDESVHIREWSAEQHRGLGKNSMYRVGLRKPASECRTQASRTRAENKRASVAIRAITREPATLCADIQTSSGTFYLPESDVIVHNCEDLAGWLAAERTVRDRIPSLAVFREFPQTTPDGGTKMLYHIVVQRADGVIEDPSKVLGMR